MIGVFRKSSGKLISIGFLSIGVFVLMQVVLPIISFQIWTMRQQYDNQILISPGEKGKEVLGISIQNQNNFPGFVSSSVRETNVSYNQFKLTVPRLKIIDGVVNVDSNDLSKGMVHLPGSGLPGEKGNVFISGHSALSRFFLGGKAIFANLQDLRKDDEMILEAGSNKFVYKVIGIKVVDPSDLSVISAPDTQGRYVSLMTCVPPGLNLKRLVVLGKML